MGNCVSCGGSRATPNPGNRRMGGSARGAVSMRRSVPQTVWVVECPDGTRTDVTGDAAAFEAASRCGGSYTPKSATTSKQPQGES